jgi:hypothetical protein
MSTQNFDRVSTGSARLPEAGQQTARRSDVHLECKRKRPCDGGRFSSEVGDEG